MEQIFSSVLKALLKLRNSTIERLCVKLSGRVALVELKPRDAQWKYNRGARVTVNQKENVSEVKEEAEDEIEVSDTVESVLGLLLNALNHEATVVRNGFFIFVKH